MDPTVFLWALIPPFLYALTNHIDKALLEKYFKEGGVGTLMIFSAFLSGLALPFIIYGDPTVLSTQMGSTSFHLNIFGGAITFTLANILVLAIVAVLDVAILWFYLKALESDEASITIVFYQLVPVFALGLGYAILHEMPTKMQLIGMGIILIGTSIASFEIDKENKFKPRTKTIVYMTLACFCWALESVLFKDVALEDNVWRSLFWEHLVLVGLGVCMFVFIPKYRNSFKDTFRLNSKAILSLNVVNESLYMIGNITVAFVIMLAPVSLVLLNVPIQSVFVFVIGAFLTIFFPNISKENLETKHLIQKILAISLTAYGSYFLVTN